MNQDEKCTGPSAIARSEEQLLEMISSIKELAKYGQDMSVDFSTQKFMIYFR